MLMVEGGRIDHAHHGTNAARALEDTDAFDLAVQAALDMTDAEDTLIIVTADHSHTMTLAGYPPRGNPILGKVQYPTGAFAMAADGKPYTTLGYMNGPGAAVRGKCRPVRAVRAADLTDTDTSANDYRQQARCRCPRKPMPVKMCRSSPAARRAACFRRHGAARDIPCDRPRHGPCGPAAAEPE